MRFCCFELEEGSALAVFAACCCTDGSGFDDEEPSRANLDAEKARTGAVAAGRTAAALSGAAKIDRANIVSEPDPLLACACVRKEVSGEQGFGSRLHRHFLSFRARDSRGR